MVATSFTYQATTLPAFLFRSAHQHGLCDILTSLEK